MTTIEQVREGMHVVDASGERVGKVRDVRMGDPDAITAEGQELDPVDSPVIEALRDVLGADDDIPEQQAEHLLRTGFVRVNRTLHRDFFAAPDDLERVDGDTVFLTIDAP